MPWSCHIIDYKKTRQYRRGEVSIYYSHPCQHYFRGSKSVVFFPSTWWNPETNTFLQRRERRMRYQSWQLNGLAGLSSVRFLVHFTTDVLSAYILWVQTLGISLFQGMLQKINRAQFEIITDVHKINMKNKLKGGFLLLTQESPFVITIDSLENSHNFII